MEKGSFGTPENPTITTDFIPEPAGPLPDTLDDAVHRAFERSQDIDGMSESDVGESFRLILREKRKRIQQMN